VGVGAVGVGAVGRHRLELAPRRMLFATCASSPARAAQMPDRDRPDQYLGPHTVPATACDRLVEPAAKGVDRSPKPVRLRR
jgi:hypothetical protein